MTIQQTTFPTHISFSVTEQGGPIPAWTLAYFRGRLSNRVHELVLSEFSNLEQNNQMNRAKLAKKIGRKPEQITRWLSAPGNWTLDTISDILLGMGYELNISAITPGQNNPPSVIGNNFPSLPNKPDNFTDDVTKNSLCLPSWRTPAREERRGL